MKHIRITILVALFSITPFYNSQTDSFELGQELKAQSHEWGWYELWAVTTTEFVDYSGPGNSACFAEYEITYTAYRCEYAMNECTPTQLSVADRELIETVCIEDL